MLWHSLFLTSLPFPKGRRKENAAKDGCGTEGHAQRNRLVDEQYAADGGDHGDAQLDDSRNGDRKPNHDHIPNHLTARGSQRTGRQRVPHTGIIETHLRRQAKHHEQSEGDGLHEIARG